MSFTSSKKKIRADVTVKGKRECKYRGFVKGEVWVKKEWYYDIKTHAQTHTHNT